MAAVLSLPLASVVAVPRAGAAVDGSETFSFTGAAQTFTVPDGVFAITVDAYGAAGGSGAGQASFVPIAGSPGGLGGRTTAVVAVSPGEELTVLVGGQGGDGSVAFDDEVDLTISGSAGAPGFNGGGCGTLSLIAATAAGAGESQVVCGSASLSLEGRRVGAGSVAGGGGGASDVRRGAERLVVAGGGGGGGGATANADDVPANIVADPGGAGGGGGGEVGSDGSPGLNGSPGGTGATATDPGSGAGCATAPSSGEGGSAAGVTGLFLGQPPYRFARSTAAGGGGWFGGGCSEVVGDFGGQGGGGGGSGRGPEAAFEAGVREGDGQVVISWTAGAEPPTPPPATPPGEQPTEPPMAPVEPPAAAPVAAAPRYVG
jgi:hypothetical protein